MFAVKSLQYLSENTQWWIFWSLVWARPFPWWQSGGPIIGAATGRRGLGGQLKCGRELIERQSTVCLYSIERSLSLKSDADAGQGWSKKFQIGSWNWRHNAHLDMQQQYTQIGNDSCTTSSDFYIGGSARCQLGDRGMHLAEKSDQDTLAIPYCHFQPEIRFRYQVTRKPPQNARSESG